MTRAGTLVEQLRQSLWVFPALCIVGAVAAGDGAGRPSFPVRLLELLAALRNSGAALAAGFAELSRQARLISEGASALADVPADARFVEASYERLHGPRSQRVGELTHPPGRRPGMATAPVVASVISGRLGVRPGEREGRPW